MPLPGCACYVSRDDVGGMPVQTAACPVVPNRRARVGVRRGFLHVTQWDPGIKRGGDGRMSERVGA